LAQHIVRPLLAIAWLAIAWLAIACEGRDLVELRPVSSDGGSAGMAAGGAPGGRTLGGAAGAGGSAGTGSARSSDDLDAGIEDSSVSSGVSCVPPSWYPEVPDAGDAGEDPVQSAHASSCATLCHDKFVFTAYWESAQGYVCEPVDEQQCNEECRHPAVDCPEYWNVVGCSAYPDGFQGSWACPAGKAVMRGCEYFEGELATSCRCRP
jgi:hypothetical protein